MSFQVFRQTLYKVYNTFCKQRGLVNTCSFKRANQQRQNNNAASVGAAAASNVNNGAKHSAVGGGGQVSSAQAVRLKIASSDETENTKLVSAETLQQPQPPGKFADNGSVATTTVMVTADVAKTAAAASIDNSGDASV